MRTLPIAAAGLIVCLGLCTFANADPPDPSAKPASGFTQYWPPNWFAPKPAPKAKNPEPTAAHVDERAKIAASTLYSREQEKAAWMRREQVCDKLREIAVSNGDDALLRKAEVLSYRAYTLYLQRTSSGPVVLDGESRLLESSDRGTSLVPGSMPVRPGSGQANARRDY
jgi:hypothetical protein